MSNVSSARNDLYGVVLPVPEPKKSELEAPSIFSHPKSEVEEFAPAQDLELTQGQASFSFEQEEDFVSEVSTIDALIASCAPLEAPEKENFPQTTPLVSRFSQKWESVSPSKKKLLPELKRFGVVFIIVFSLFFLFTNAKLVLLKFSDNLGQESLPSETWSVLEEENTNLTSEAKVLADEQLEKIQALEAEFAALPRGVSEVEALAPHLEEFLNQKTTHQNFDFNTLPPGNRLIIPSLNINVPLIDVPVKDEVDFSKGDFDEELEHGVVKYPTTQTPDKHSGNTLIFGHTSLERRKKNEYGYVFRNIPKLKAGDEFFVIRGGKKYHYRMIERKVVIPKKVNEYYKSFTDTNKSYVTLMGCYPIGTNEKRIMVVAEKVEA